MWSECGHISMIYLPFFFFFFFPLQIPPSEMFEFFSVLLVYLFFPSAFAGDIGGV